MKAAKPFAARGGGAELLDDVRTFIRRFIAFPSDAALQAVTLWAAHAHMAEHFHTSPRLALLSPEPGSGKTRVLEVLEPLVPKAMFTFSASPAAIFRTLAVEQRTLLFDEVDAIFSKRGKDGDANEDLRALLNVGYRRGATIPRCVGPKHEVQTFDVFAPSALAGLGDLPDTLMSRSIIIRMRRRAPREHVEQFRLRMHEAAGQELCARMSVWGQDVGPTVGDAWPDLPPGVVDRDAEVWEPLLAIADAAGGHWPDTARDACTELLKVASDREVSLGVRLLADVRTVFGERDAMTTVDILDGLNDMDEAPWGDLYGKKMEARMLARMLKRYAVQSTKVKVDGRSLQGYRREDLWDTWVRYLTPPSGSAEPEPPEPPPGSREAHASTVPQATRRPEPEEPVRSEPSANPVPQVPEPATETEPSARVPDGSGPQVPEVPLLQNPSGRLTDRAAGVVANLRGLTVDELRDRYRAVAARITAAGRLSIPSFIETTAKTQPVEVVATLELIADDSDAGQRVSPWPTYLDASRSATGATHQ